MPAPGSALGICTVLHLGQSSAGRRLAYLGEVERSDSAVVIQEDIDSVQSPRTFSQKT